MCWYCDASSIDSMKSCNIRLARVTNASTPNPPKPNYVRPRRSPQPQSSHTSGTSQKRSHLRYASQNGTGRRRALVRQHLLFNARENALQVVKLPACGVDLDAEHFSLVLDVAHGCLGQGLAEQVSHHGFVVTVVGLDHVGHVHRLQHKERLRAELRRLVQGGRDPFVQLELGGGADTAMEQREPQCASGPRCHCVHAHRGGAQQARRRGAGSWALTEAPAPTHLLCTLLHVDLARHCPLGVKGILDAVRRLGMVQPHCKVPFLLARGIRGLAPRDPLGEGQLVEDNLVRHKAIQHRLHLSDEAGPGTLSRRCSSHPPPPAPPPPPTRRNSLAAWTWLRKSGAADWGRPRPLRCPAPAAVLRVLQAAHSHARAHTLGLLSSSAVLLPVLLRRTFGGVVTN